MAKYFYQKWPLLAQITAALLILCACIVIATGEYVRHTEHSYLLKNIEDNKRRLIDIIGSSAIESIITEDAPVLNTIVSQLTTSSSDITLLKILNENNVVLAEWSSKEAVSDKDMLSHSEPIIFEGEVFGFIELNWNLSNKRADIDKHIAGTYIFNSISLFFLTVISIVGVNWLVIRPLHDIEMRLLHHAKGKKISKNKIKSSREFINLYGAVDKIRSLTTSKDRLQKEVEQRRQAQQELARARDAAVTATRAKSTFLANMSHEIRTPLTAIIGFSESLLDGDQTMSDRVDSIQTVIRSGKHLQSLINDILDLSKIEAGKLDIEVVESPLFEILADVHALALLQTEEKELYCKLDYHFPLPEIFLTDSLRLKQILINLCSNAIKFTESGGITIDVSFNEDGNLLVIKVIDTGIGMTPEQQEKLFKAFSQADASTTRKFGGTGLGLHLSQLLANKLNGNITVKSAEGQGSCFTLTLDNGRVEQQKLINAVPDHSKVKVEQTVYTLSGHVLLAEDNLDNQRLISFLIKKLGVDVTLAENGEKAVELALANKFDLILMDMQMPVMDGLSATRLLREKGYQGTIIALTANALRKDRDDCLAAGCDDFLTKPIDRSRFAQVISEYLRNDDSPDYRQESSLDSITSSLIDDPDVADLLEKYIENLPAIVEEIKTAYSGNDYETLRRCVHDLKSSGGNYGFVPLYQAAADLEFEIVKQNKEGMNKRIAEIDSIKTRICGK